MAGSYDIGDLVTLTATFTVATVATDPTTISLVIEDPSANEVTYTYALGEITKSGTGIYTKNISIDEHGVWRYKFTGTGTCQAVEEGQFFVKQSRI